MPWIKFVKGFPDIEVPKGSNLRETLRENGRPVASSCRGQAVCTKCVIKIIEGLQNLSLQNQAEKDLRDIHDIPKDSRVSCQTSVEGDITVDTTYW
ncbi:MAG: 2Fe-2S iron-sulfur cluster-binding protein [Pseudomonadota bacterium]|nr:2Fe-2S iron-sulfur cluster-binding protein [Pseudomonadota bacterium]